MEAQEKNTERLSSYISVNCVLLGFNESKMYVLLQKQTDFPELPVKFKLPERWVYADENPDDIAGRIACESVDNRKMNLVQFRTYANRERMNFPADKQWLQHTLKPGVRRIVSIAYLSLLKLPGRVAATTRRKPVKWHPVEKIPKHLPLDQNLMIEDALAEVRKWIDDEPIMAFEFLPFKFTAYQLRRLYEIIYDREMDVRNFQKRISSLSYIEPLDEWEEDVPHRAARYYRFDKKKYNQQRSGLNKN